MKMQSMLRSTVNSQNSNFFFGLSDGELYINRAQVDCVSHTCHAIFNTHCPDSSQVFAVLCNLFSPAK